VVKKLGLRQSIIFVALLVVVLNCAVAYNLYQRGAQLPPAVSTVAVGAAAERPAVSGELSVLLAPHKVASGQYKIIEEKNLFSAQRQAWQPEKPVSSAAVPPTGGAPKRGDVVLDATFDVAGRKGAILRFLRFSKQLQRQRLYQGQEAVDTTRGKNIRYSLLKVEKDLVRVRDQYGKVFDVGLYDNKKHATNNVAPDTPQVIIGKSVAASGNVATATPGNPLVPLVYKAPHQRGHQPTAEQLSAGEYKPVKTPFGISYVRTLQHKK